jgi:hypothetical protein
MEIGWEVVDWIYLTQNREKWRVLVNTVMKPLGRPRSRWEDNIRMNLWEIGRKGVDWIHLDQDSTTGELM